MASESEIYKECCKEIVKISGLFSEWCIAKFIEEEELDVTNAPLLLSTLKDYRERLELDNHVIQNDEETKQILEEGMRIHSILIKQQMYGED